MYVSWKVFVLYPPKFRPLVLVCQWIVPLVYPEVLVGPTLWYLHIWADASGYSSSLCFDRFCKKYLISLIIWFLDIFNFYDLQNRRHFLNFFFLLLLINQVLRVNMQVKASRDTMLLISFLHDLQIALMFLLTPTFSRKTSTLELSDV